MKTKTVRAAPAKTPLKRRQTAVSDPSSELEVDEFIIGVVADLEQHQHEHDRHSDSDGPPWRNAVSRSPGGWTEDGDGRRQGDGAPLEVCPQRREPEQALVDTKRRIEGRRSERHPA